MARPLKDLLAEADKYLAPSPTASGISKEASSVDSHTSEINWVADSLMSVTQLLEEGAVKTASAVDPEFEKLAMAMNRVHAREQAAELVKAAAFAAKAASEGFTEFQIEEALSKHASKKVHKVLPMLAAVEGYASSTPDMNTFKKKKVSATDLPNNANMKDASRGLGE